MLVTGDGRCRSRGHWEPATSPVARPTPPNRATTGRLPPTVRVPILPACSLSAKLKPPQSVPTPEAFGFKLNWQKLREAPRLDQQLVAGHLDRGSWCDTYQQLYRLIRNLLVLINELAFISIPFLVLTRVMQQLIVVWIDGALRTSA